MGAPASLQAHWDGPSLVVRVRPRGPVPAAPVAALVTAPGAGAFLVSFALHAAGAEGAALLALVAVPVLPGLMVLGLPAWLRRWRQRVVDVVVRSPALLLGRRPVPLDGLTEATPVLRQSGYALRLVTDRGVVELPLGGHDLDAVRWLWAAVERQRRLHHELPGPHRQALRRLQALRGPPRAE